MQGSDEKTLTAKQEKALLALLAHGTLKEAAAACGMYETTLWRMMQLPHFQSSYRASRRQVVEAAIAQLQAGCSVAVRVLLEVAEDEQASSSARVSAAKIVLDQSVSALELTDLQERVEQLEKQFGEHQTTNRFTRSAKQ
jgi:hypothetical protein